MLHVVFKRHSLLPTWNNFVDAPRSRTVGEVRLACSAQETTDAATHHHALAVPASQAHAWKTPLPNSTVTHKHPPVFASPYPLPPQPHPSHSLPWAVPNNYPQLANYPLSTQFLPPPPSEADSPSATLPVHLPLPQITPGSTPSRFIPPTLVPVQPPFHLMLYKILSHYPVEPEVAAGM